MTPSRALSLLLGLTFCLGPPQTPEASAMVVYVDRESTAVAPDGRSWQTAFPSLSAGLSAGGDEVWVANGTYAEHVAVPANVSVYGGFAGTETDRTQRDLRSHPTVLDAGTITNDAVFCKGANTVVDGLAIRGGRYGVYVSGGRTSLRRCTVSGAMLYGVVVASSTAELSNNVVYGNAKDGVYISFGTATLTNNTIADNGGHGVNAFFGESVRMADNLIAFNGSRGVNRSSTPIPTFRYNDVFGNTGGDYGGFTPPAEQGNVSLAPEFVDRVGHDYHLAATSPCRDAGDDAAAAPIGVDRDGAPRIQGMHVDVGAYEFGPVNPVPFTRIDVARCLSIAGGLTAGLTDDTTRLNVEAGGACLDLFDALRMARKVAGQEQNP